MHSHICRYCEKDFICPEDAAECFQKYIVCRDCFWAYEAKHFLLVFFLSCLAIGATVYLFRNLKRPARVPAAPVVSLSQVTTTTKGNYYKNDRETNTRRQKERTRFD